MRSFSYTSIIFALAGLTSTFVACKTTTSGSAPVSIVTIDAKTGEREINWSCAGEFRANSVAPGEITQEEYCEWRQTTNTDGATVCSFNASFDSSRNEYLTQRRTERKYRHTGVNSYGALIGLVNHCAVVGNTCDGFACVPDRASDPQVCEAIQQTVRAGKTAELKDYRGVVPLQGSEVASQGGYRFQLSAAEAVSSLCTASVDAGLPGGSRADGTQLNCVVPTGTTITGNPLKETCDRVAQHITIRARYFERAAAAAPAPSPSPESTPSDAPAADEGETRQRPEGT